MNPVDYRLCGLWSHIAAHTCIRYDSTISANRLDVWSGLLSGIVDTAVREWRKNASVFAKRGHPERVRAAAIAYVRPCWPPFYNRIDRHVCTLILLSKQMSWWSAVRIWLTDNSCQYNYEYCVFLPSGKAVMLQFLFNTFAQNIKVGQCLFKLQLNSRQFFLCEIRLVFSVNFDRYQWCRRNCHLYSWRPLRVVSSLCCH